MARGDGGSEDEAGMRQVDFPHGSDGGTYSRIMSAVSRLAPRTLQFWRMMTTAARRSRSTGTWLPPRAATCQTGSEPQKVGLSMPISVG